MYCNRCGKPVDDDDRFCRNCGNELKRAIDEASRERNNTSMTFTSFSNREAPEQEDSNAESQKPHRISTDEFVWNIHTFDRPAPKQEQVYVDWSKGQVVEIDLTEERNDKEEQAAVEETVLEVKGDFLKDAEDHIKQNASQSTESPYEELQEHSHRAREAEEIVLQNEDIPVTIDDIQKDVEEGNADLKRATARIDKFYTFNQKNEQFQKLLDKEYERVHGKVPPDTAEIYLEFQRLTNLNYQEQELPDDIVTVEDGEFPTEGDLDERMSQGADIHKQAELLPSEREAQVVTREERPEDQTDPWIRAQEKRKIENLAASVEEPIKKKEPIKEKETFDPVEHIRQAAIARQEELAKAGIFENSALIKKFDTMQLEKDLIENELPEVKKDKRFESAVLNELFGEVPKTESEAGTAGSSESLTRENADKAKSKDHGTSASTSVAAVSTSKATAEDADNAKKQEAAPENEIFVPVLAENENEKEKEQEQVGAPIQKKGNGGKYFLRTLIAIVAIIALVSVTAVAIIEMAPESKAAEFIQEEVKPVFDKAFASVAAIFGGGDNAPGAEKNDDDSDTVENDVPVSMSMQEIISSQLGNNANIEVILPDINLGYNKSIDYGNQDLNKSVILSQKYTSVEEYNKHASEIVETLIKFDSQWINYVNNKDRAVFDLLKKDSNAYRNCNAFTKAGLLKKEFKELRIGEMRAGADGYYIWADEKIVTIENGQSTEDNHSWIYYLESNGTDIRIVDYIRDKDQAA